MRIGELISGLPVQVLAGSADTDISGLADDSRAVTPGSLFIARPGSLSDGIKYVHDALQRGAIAVLTHQPLELPPHLPVTVLLSPELTPTARTATCRFFHYPQQHLKLIAITGTKGKTTSAFMLRHLLRASGKKCGMIGTIEIDDGKTVTPAKLTTPGHVELIATLAAMVQNGCEACVMETSSHALDQGRIDGLDFRVAIFTNLTGDHLDYHQTMDAYAAAKARLFDSLSVDSWAVINVDDPASSRMVRNTKAGVLSFSLVEPHPQDPHSSLATTVDATAHYTDVHCKGPFGEFDVKLPLIGRHNVQNMMGALNACWALGLNMNTVRRAIEDFPLVPGRLEPVRIGDQQPFAVLVDYAHTDDALRNALSALRPLTRGKLSVVFGCGGDRDNTKRPRMAAVACQLADTVIITSDNPRTEDPARIIDMIRAGVPASAADKVTVIPDRAAAIKLAIEQVQEDDVLLIAGKGHEDYQIIGATKHPFDDRIHARLALEARFAPKGRH